MAKKLTGEEDVSGDILRKLEDAPLQREVLPGVVVNLENPGDYDSRAMKAKALANVEAALLKQEATVSGLRFGCVCHLKIVCVPLCVCVCFKNLTWLLLCVYGCVVQL